MESADQPEATEDKRTDSRAVQIVIELEKRFGRDARDVRGRKSVADVESSGRLIEVKGVGGSFKPRLGTLLFTPAQMRHARDNEAYFVYLVENVKQVDPAKVQVRILHGEHLRKVVTDPGVEIQRYSVPLRRADYDNLPQLEE